jgi:hypothetical protein
LEQRDNTALFLGGGVLVLVLLWRKVVKPGAVTPVQTLNYISRLRFIISGVKFKSGNNLEFELFIENPNERKILVKSIVGELYLEGNQKQTIYKLGTVSRYGVTEVKANAETKLPFSVRLKILQLVGALSDWAAGKLKNRFLRFIGTINIDGQLYPLNITYQI